MGVLNHRRTTRDRNSGMAITLIHRNAGQARYWIYRASKPQGKIDDQLAATDHRFEHSLA
jgi:hypothetical protein